ncbi:hypothetical protein HQ560_02725, partial [bacterium]|nr:hypothetical protein [bacterium]
AWTILLILFRLVQMNYWVIVRLVGVASFVVFWAMLVILNRKLAGDDPRRRAINFPLIHLSLTYGVLCYFTSGLESPLVLLCGVAYPCFFLYPRSRALAVLVGVAPLIRHELAVPFFIAALWFVLSEKRVPWLLAGSFVAAIGGWGIFRIVYYADLFPNTFYLKNEWLVGQGFVYLWDTARPYLTVPIALFFLVVSRSLRRGGVDVQRKPRAMMWAVAVPVLLFVVKIGGDPRHFRFLIFPYCAILCSTGGLLERLEKPRTRGWAFMLVVALAALTATRYPSQLADHPLLCWEETDHKQKRKINDALVHRLRRTITPSPWGLGWEIELGDKMRAYRRDHPDMPATHIVASSRCMLSFKDFSAYIIQDLGLTEPFLARTIMRSNRPAHKLGLVPMGAKIAEIRQRYGFRQGAFRAAIEDGNAPSWVAPNLDIIERIERKAYNRHNFVENLALAFTPAERIDPRPEPATRW